MGWYEFTGNSLVGAEAGGVVSGFLKSGLAKTTDDFPDGAGAAAFLNGFLNANLLLACMSGRNPMLFILSS